ncbi:MAG: DinB family protein [Myxococcota bacterium]
MAPQFHLQTRNTMITPTYLAEMAAYNTWQNQRLLELCGALEEQALHHDRGLFFGSISATLYHILHIDHLIVRYVRDGVSPTGKRPVSYDTFAEFQDARNAFDEEIAAFAEAVETDWLAETIPIWGGRQVPRALLLMQLFNHQTHHRSQITTHLHMMGVDYGNTDIPFCPGSRWA